MRATIGNFDHLVKLTMEGGVDVGDIPGGVGLDRLRWSGSALIDLNDLTAIHVRQVNGVWNFHSIPVPGSQLVNMTWAERKRLVNEAGTFRALSQAEVDQAATDDQADQADTRTLRQELETLVLNTTAAKIDNRIDNAWGTLTTQEERDAMIVDLRRGLKVLLKLAKKELR